MRKRFKLLNIVAMLCLGAGWAEAAAVTGRVSDVTGKPVTANTFVRFELKNCASNIPRVIGQTIVVPSVKDVVPNALGLLHGQVLGNDIITCDVLGNTFYRVTVWDARTKIYDNNFYVSGSLWDITGATILSGDPTAVLTFQSYATGDLLVASGVNQISVLHGNKETQRKFLGMAGNGSLPGAWDWYGLRPEDIPGGIPATKIVGLEDVGAGMSEMPALSGDVSSLPGATSLKVTGLQGKPVSTAAPFDGQGLAYNGTTGKWEPKAQAPGGVTAFKTRTGAVVPQSGDYDFGMISGSAAVSQIPAGIPVSKLATGLVSDAEFTYVRGVTSGIQAQIDGKSALGHGHNFSSLTGTVGDSQITSGINATKIGNGSVSNTKLSYLAGVTSDLQAQIDGKMSTAQDLNASGRVIKIQGQAVASTAPASGQVLAWNGSQWAPQDIDAGSVTLSGDVSGPATAAVIQKLRGVAISATLPSAAGQALLFNGTQWAPGSVSVTASQVSDFATAADARISAQKGVSNGLASLGADGKLASGQIPATVMNNSSVVSSQAAQLGLTAVVGDVAIRSDLSKSYVKNSGTAGTMTDWNELLSPTSPVQSVNGQTGIISLSSSNISEGSNLYFTSARVVASSIAGDVTGTIGAATVSKVQGKAVSAATPSTGQVMKWDGTQWGPGTDIGSAGADAVSLRSVSISVATPSTGQVLQYNGSVWSPETLVPALSGDLSGNTGAATVTRIQGRAVDASAPGIGQVIKWSGTQWAPADDIGSSGADATSIRGVTIAATVPTSGQFLQYNGSQYVPAGIPAQNPNMGGDVTGTAGVSTVGKLRGRIVSASAPTDGQHLTWNNSSSQWEPTTVAISTTASSIQSVAVAATAPTTGQLLQYNGTQWAPATLTTDPAMGADLSGTASTARVVKLQGRTMASTAPTAGQYLIWNGSTSQWEPKTVSSSTNATAIQNINVASTAPTSGQVLQYNGTQYVPVTVTLNGANASSIQNINVATATPTTNQQFVYNGSQWAPKDDVHQISYVISDPANDLTPAAGSVADLFTNLSGGSWTILSVSCKTDNATASTFNLIAGGSNVFASAQSCNSTAGTFSSFASSVVPTGTTASHTLVAAATGTKRMSITIRYKQ